MTATGIITGIFTAVGVLAVTALVLYLIAKALKKYNPSSSSSQYPSDEYMEKVGAKCPDGWVYKGKIRGNDGSEHDVCHNRYNVPVCRDWIGSDPNKGAGCYSSDGTATFPVINKWDDYMNGDVANSYRCGWIRRCGPPSDDQTCDTSPPASWTGLNGKC